MIPPFRLRATNQWGERHYFCNLGGFWGIGDTRRLIERTSEKFSNGKEFATVEEAMEVLTLTDNKVAQPDEQGGVKGWQIVDADGVVVK